MDETAYISHTETVLNERGWCLLPLGYNRLKQCQEEAAPALRAGFRYLADEGGII